MHVTGYCVYLTRLAKYPSTGHKHWVHLAYSWPYIGNSDKITFSVEIVDLLWQALIENLFENNSINTVNNKSIQQISKEFKSVNKCCKVKKTKVSHWFKRELIIVIDLVRVNDYGTPVFPAWIACLENQHLKFNWGQVLTFDKIIPSKK